MKKIRTHKSLHFFSPQTLHKQIEVLFRTLSYREMEIIENLQTNNEYKKSFYYACKFGIKELVTLNDTKIDLNTLPPQTIDEIGQEIINKSAITQEEYEKLELSIEIHLDSKFKEKTWNCEYCKKRGLDRQRNCGYRGEFDKNKDFKILVNGKLFTSCPIYYTDKEILADAILCFNIFDNNQLPDDGGFFDQTKFFCLSVFKIKEKLNKEQEKELEKLKRQNS
jgi:hypothetical protein